MNCSAVCGTPPAAHRGAPQHHPPDNGLHVAITEQRSKEDIDRLAEVLKEALAA